MKYVRVFGKRRLGGVRMCQRVVFLFRFWESEIQPGIFTLVGSATQSSVNMYLQRWDDFKKLK